MVSGAAVTVSLYRELIRQNQWQSSVQGFIKQLNYCKAEGHRAINLIKITSLQVHHISLLTQPNPKLHTRAVVPNQGYYVYPHGVLEKIHETIGILVKCT